MVMKTARLAFASASTVAMMVVLTGAAYAQDSDDLKLETVTVTGQRGFGTDVTQVGSFRGAHMIDTPMTINVLPKDLLEAQQALNLNDALRNVAGVNNSQTSTVITSGQSVRGIALDNRNGYRIDGSLPIINLMDEPTEDKERVELMKGASGLYYGFASPAGVVNLTMKRPTQEPLMDMSLFGNEYGALGTSIDFGETVGDGKFGYRINGVYTGVNPGITNTVGTRSLIAGAFDYKPIESVTMQLDLEHIYKNEPEPGIFRFVTLPTPTLATPYPSIALPNIKAIDPTKNWAPNWAYYRGEETNVLSHNTWNITDAWAFTVDVGDSKFDRRRTFTTIQPTNLATGDGNEQFAISIQQSENRNARLEVAGTFETFGLVHNVSLGWSDNIRDSYAVNAPTTACTGGAYQPTTVLSGTTATAVACQTGITSVNGISVNYLNPMPFTNAMVRQSTPNFVGNVTRIDDMGYYVFDRISWEQYVDVLGGVRLGNYNESTQKPVYTPTFHAAPVTYAGSVVGKPLGSDDLSVYASYIEALETTPAAPTTASNFPFQPPPTPSFEREFGIKYEPWKGLLGQVSYFDIGRGNAVIDGNNNYGLNGRSKFAGFEGSITGDITDDLSVAASGMLLMAKVVSGTPTCGPGTAIGTLNGACKVFTPTLIGNEVDNTAKAYGSLFVQYKLEDFVPGLSVNGGVYYVGSRFINPLNEALVGSYALYDLGAAYSTNAFAYPLTFRVNARNVGGERYWAATSANLLAEGQPSDVDFSLEARF